MYKLYRKLSSGTWKYTDTFNSTLDPNYHEAINYFNNNRIVWKLTDSNGYIKFKSEIE